MDAHSLAHHGGSRFRRPVTLALIAGVLTVFSPAQTTLPGETPPRGIFIEAESVAVDGSTVSAREGAYGGKAVTSSGNWGILIRVPNPALSGVVTIWARHRGGTMGFKKADATGPMTDLTYLAGGDTEWTWSRLGRIDTSHFGTAFLCNRGPLTGEGVELDCLVFATGTNEAPLAPVVRNTGGVDLTRPMPEERAITVANPPTLDVSVDWKGRLGDIKATSWCVNEPELTSAQALSTNADFPRYQEYLARVGGPMVRLMISGAHSNGNRGWDREKIQRGLQEFTGLKGSKLLVCVTSWPEWIHSKKEGKILPREKWPALADHMKSLVRHFHDDFKQPVAYWEILNEQEPGYEAARKIDELWELLRYLAAAMRAEHPGAVIGGPALCWPHHSMAKSFTASCSAELDFFSFHMYPSGSPTTPNEKLFGSVFTGAKTLGEVVGIVRSNRTRSGFKVFLTEYNVQAVWSPFERRHGNSVGAAWMLSAIKNFSLTGVDGIFAWHARGYYYGLIDQESRMRPTGALYLLGRQFLTGAVAPSTTPDPLACELVPVVASNGVTLALINKTMKNMKIRGGWELLSGAGVSITGRGPLQALRIDSTGPGITTLKPGTGDLDLPGFSVTLLTTCPPSAFPLPENENRLEKEKPTDGSGSTTVPVPRPTCSPFVDGDRVAAIGDSITHGGMYLLYLTDFYLTRFPGHKIRIDNRGISGDIAMNASMRWNHDIGPSPFNVATFMLGMNDVGRSLYGPPATGEILEKRERGISNWARSMKSLIGRATNRGASVVLLAPSIYDQTGVQTSSNEIGVNDALARLGESNRLVACEGGFGFVDFQTPLLAANRVVQATNPAASIVGGDRVHPGEAGNLVMAHAFVGAQGLLSPVARLILDAPSGSAVESENCEVRSVVSKPGSLAFTYAPRALPFPLVEPYATVDPLVDLTRTLNREVLMLRGLARGKWELRCEGEVLGIFGDEDFARGINLATNILYPGQVLATAIHRTNLLRRTLENKLRSIRLMEVTPGWADWRISGSNSPAVLAWHEKRIAEAPEGRGKKDLMARLETYRQNKANESAMEADLNRMWEVLWKMGRTGTYRMEMKRVGERP